MFHVTTMPTTGSGAIAATAPHPSADAIERLRPLLRSASHLDLRDHEGWVRLRRAARTTLGALIEGGRLPAHLTVAEDDAPVVVQRVVAAAWRHATEVPHRRAAGSIPRRATA